MRSMSTASRTRPENRPRSNLRTTFAAAVVWSAIDGKQPTMNDPAEFSSLTTPTEAGTVSTAPSDAVVVGSTASGPTTLGGSTSTGPTDTVVTATAVAVMVDEIFDDPVTVEPEEEPTEDPKEMGTDDAARNKKLVMIGVAALLLVVGIVGAAVGISSGGGGSSDSSPTPAPTPPVEYPIAFTSTDELYEAVDEYLELVYPETTAATDDTTNRRLQFGRSKPNVTERYGLINDWDVSRITGSYERTERHAVALLLAVALLSFWYLTLCSFVGVSRYKKTSRWCFTLTERTTTRTSHSNLFQPLQPSTRTLSIGM